LTSSFPALPQAVVDNIVDSLVARVREAAKSGRKLRPTGGGTKDFYGERLQGEPLDMKPLSGIVAYEPTELVVTVRAGTSLAELQTTLRREHQYLAFEPPHFGAGATVGGCVASGLSGPSRMRTGPLRDFVLGVKVLDGRGDVLSFGGQVMKNVAGYDVSRLIAGSLGTLAVILEVSLKVLPEPPAQSTLVFDFDAVTAVRRVNEWIGAALPVASNAWRNGRLWLRLAGAAAAVDAARATLGGETMSPDQAEKLWEGLREQTDPFFAGDRPLWRLAVPATVEPLALQGDQLIEWNGAQRWWRTDRPAQQVRDVARAAGGHATLFRSALREAVFTPPDPVLMKLQRNLKEAFDPHRIFSPGRLYPDL
jgi:glycolate oxidase FAD binding subunit